ncbi:TPA: anion transporter [Candidatus Woesearchaeota archaeon]|nr:anion transporter [Candidatus Woesearchaeota archaeon]HII69135.1 anion transporter [Candidatus Woesearchaeota archaeon]
MNIPIIIVGIIFFLIAIRQLSGMKMQIWQIMAGGAVAVLMMGQISVTFALQSINREVMLFLFCMFVIGAALEESGYLSHLSYKLFRRAKNESHLLLLILFGMGLASAILMNDTLAIIGTPVVLLLAKKHGIRPKVLLLALCMAITIGSVASPIGNPQNLLIASDKSMHNPFITFLLFLLVPTIINLFLAFLLLRLFYKEEFKNSILVHSQEPIRDHSLTRLSKASLLVLIALIILKILLAFFGTGAGISLTLIAALACLPVLIGSKKRLLLIRKVDWHTLLFFASMFIVMQSVWDTGFFQHAISAMQLDITSIPAIIGVSVVVSQFISNVPLVALYLPLLSHAGATATELMALAAGSTIAGNLLILGAASNVIVIQNAEKKSGESITFLEFARIGVPLTILNIAVYWLFLSFL